ncbi:WD-40 repeat-containing protein [[Leptolyngbya] sp. PCC 7376]|uniref:WD40 repeat domain-containing protein n=1 Tax=[Leptolyngbya] sp. PCC 7376 TaxID=111781 RepID=UPI00029EF5D4|nr:WD40 repeat domain-containing protein [[Leptolyngbya] sp. PCC 7376]AFY37793.1 WD-40 repeat-containing protein [[Leptolyngbya] sp. PCC 7376]
MVKKRQWLELAELGLLLATLITVIWSFFDGLWQIPLIFLTLTLGINIFNRLNLQQRQRKQFFGAIRRLENKFQGQLDQLGQQVRQSSNIKTSIASLKTKDEMQDYLGSLEKSLTNVVQYLNEEALDERLKNLEQVLLILQQEGNIALENLPVPAPTSPAIAQEPPKSPVNDPWESKAITPLQPQSESPLPTPSPPQSVEEPQQAWQCIQVLEAHQDCVSALSFSDDQRLLASGSWDQQLKVWQVRDGKQLAQVQAHSQGLLDLCFLDGFMDRLLDGLLDGDVRPYAIASSSFEPDVKIWHIDPESSEMPEFELSQSLTKHDGSVYAIAHTPDGDVLTASHDQTIRRWRPKDGDLLATGQDLGDQIEAIACAPTSNIFVTGGKEGLLKFWRSEDHQSIGSLGSDQPEAIAAIAIRPDGQLLVSAGESGYVYLWQLDCNGLTALPETVPCFSLAAHQKAITSLRFSPQGDFLVTGCVDGTIKIWQLGINEPLATLNLNDAASKSTHSRLLSLALSADGSLLAAGSSDGRIKVWLRR